MRQKSCFIMTSVAASLLVAGAASAATYTWDGSASSSWTDPDNWDLASGFPDGVDDVAILTTAGTDPDINASVTVGQVTINDGVTLDIFDSVAPFTDPVVLTIDGNQTDANGELAIKKGNNGTGKIKLGVYGRLKFADAESHTINGDIELNDDFARVFVDESITLKIDSGNLGRVVGADDSAEVQIASGKTLTNQIMIVGNMKIVGPGTFDNEEVVIADAAGTLELASDLLLADADNADYEWIVQTNCSAVLKFARSASSLAGDFKVTSGKLFFVNDG